MTAPKHGPHRAPKHGTKPAPKHAPKHAPRVPFAVLVVTLIAGGLGLLLLLNTASAANEVRRHDLAAKDAGIGARLEDLRNEVAASAAPANVAAAAAALGMVPAGHPAFLVIGPDGSVKVVGRAKPVSDAAPAISVRTSKRPKPSHTPASTTASKTGGPAKGSTTSSSSTAAGRHPTSAAGPSPSPTPTPTLTLPGGDR